MRVYFDSVTMIYYVQGVVPWSTAIEGRLASGTVNIVTSDLTRMECRVKPLRTGDTARLQEFEVVHLASECAPITPAVFARAADLQARYFGKVKTPGAIHLAAAILAGCDSFLTNDAALLVCTEIRVELI